MNREIKEKAFSNWKHNAIRLTFPNGNSLSTTWAYCTYSDNYDSVKPIPNNPRMSESEDDWTTFSESNTCEIMILEAPDKVIRRIHKKYDGDGSVIGYLTMEQWLDVVKILSKPSNGKP